MSDIPSVLTRVSQLRKDLLQVFGGNMRLVRALEDLFEDVAKNLPDAIGGVSEEASSVLTNATFAPRPCAPAALDPAADILAAQIFGA